jgi:hypothetical protein
MMASTRKNERVHARRLAMLPRKSAGSGGERAKMGWMTQYGFIPTVKVFGMKNYCV